MPYQALYRTYRPLRFAQVVGQQHVVTTLRNQVLLNKIVHAYLFSGPRGTGKTTLARIFARAINCVDPQDGEACGVCDVCRALSQQNAMDIVELDAASNNGVDQIRDLCDKAQYPPVIGRYKVYIIDEAHMLSTGAANALLKTLEEPYAYTLFILATTEAHRLLPTVVSRCQRHEFHRIEPTDILERLRDVAGDLEINCDEESLRLIARAAEGGMRDALSLLDQCMAAIEGPISYAQAARVLGAVDRTGLFELSAAVLRSDLTACLRLMSEWMRQGRDPRVIARELANHFRSLLLATRLKDGAELLDVSAQELRAYQDHAQNASSARLLRAMQQFSALEGELRWSEMPRMALELTLIRLCRPEQEQSVEALQDRVESLERELREAPRMTAMSPAPPVERAGADELSEPPLLPLTDDPGLPWADPEPEEDMPPLFEMPEPMPEDLPPEPPLPLKQRLERMNAPQAPAKAEKAPPSRDMTAAYETACRKLKAQSVQLYNAFARGKFVGLVGDRLRLRFSPENDIYTNVLQLPNNAKVLEEIISEAFGRKLTLQLDTAEEEKPKVAPGASVEDVVSVFGRENVTIID